MTFAMRKPVLVAGIGLSLVLWGWESLNHNFAEIGQWMLWMAIAFGSGIWWLRPKTKQEIEFKPVSTINQAKVDQEIAKTQKALDILGKEDPDFDLTPLKSQLESLPQTLSDQRINIAIAGGKSTGKTTLTTRLKTENLGENVQVIDTEPLFVESSSFSLDNLQIGDLIIFIVNGDLTDTEWQALQYFQTHYQHPLLLFNKQDQYLPEDKALIVHQLRQRVEKFLSEAEVIPVSLNPQPITVRRYNPDGKMVESLESQPPELNGLIETLNTVLEQNNKNLLLGRMWRQANRLQQQTTAQINQIRRNKAIPLIEKYQWISGTMAVANPVATLDLLATAAITGQMVLDLGTIYYQSFSLSQAKAVSTEMGKLMVKLGLVELSTQTVSSLLKGNTMTYLAGGVIQGISAAYLTRIAGLSLVEYFQEQELNDKKGFQLNLGQLQEKMQEVFQNNQRIDFMKGFVSQALTKVA
ncbi:MAG: DUF697 domain-containing protein [Microcystaceae cyanobacterium]